MRFPIFFCGLDKFIKTLFAGFLNYAYLCGIINQNHKVMHLYRFFNPSAEGADSCVIIVSDNRWDAIRAYMERYYPFFHELKLYKDFDDENAILMEESVKKLNDGRVLFAWVFTIKIS